MPNNSEKFPQKQSVTDELEQLDSRIAELLAKRTELLARSARARRERGKPLASAHQEKRLWAAWDAVVRRLGAKPSLWKRCFTLLNSMAYDQATKTRDSAQVITLLPAKGDMAVDTPGPLSQRRAMHLAVLAASSGQSMDLAGVILSDPVVELAKALNQAGGHLSWEPGRLQARAGARLDFSRDMIFVGESIQVMLLMACQIAASGGHIRLSGGPTLKLADLTPLARVFNPLGARFAPIDPNAPGLPARLEATGIIESRPHLDEDQPEGLAAALALAAPCALGVEDAVEALRSMGIDARHEPGRVSVPHGEPVASGPLGLPLDPELCACLLAMPRAAGGTVRLQGRWPRRDAMAHAVESLLDQAGLDFNIGDGDVTTVKAGRPGPRVLEPGNAHLLPLALALAACTSGPTRVSIPEDFIDQGLIADFADLIAASVEIEDNAATVDRYGNALIDEPLEAPETGSRPWLAPSARWILAAAVASFRRPGIALANPGALSDAWPGFIRVYNRLPRLVGELEPVRPAKDQEDEGKDDDSRPKKRRIRIR